MSVQLEHMPDLGGALQTSTLLQDAFSENGGGKSHGQLGAPV